MKKTAQSLNSPLTPKLWLVLPAAGSGSRFSKTQLKQYQRIQDQTVIEHTVARLNHLPLAGYVLAISAQDDVAKNLNFVHQKRLHFCQGGAERVDSVLNALNYLSNIASPQDWVLVHDAARPCVSKDTLNALVEHALTHQTCTIVAIPVRDTLKRVANAPHISETVDRRELWQAQTPQIAPLAILKHAIESALAAGVAITDEASALEYVGHRVDVVQGRADNLKITYPDDLELARLVLNAQQ